MAYMDIVEALDAERGVVCAVGAGGKKSTLFALADRVESAIVTATVRIPIFDPHVADVAVTADPVAALKSTDARPLGVVPERERSDRYLGYDPGVVDDLAAAAPDATVLVKSDGARTREFKAPGDHEPRIPSSATTVVPVVSAHVVGTPLTAERVHRPGRVAAVAGMDEGDTVHAGDVAAVVASEAGGMKGVPTDASVIPVVNKVDDAELESTAQDIAREIHARVDVPRVVLAQMTATDPLVSVVE